MSCFRGNREEFYGEVLLLDETKLTLTPESGLKKSSRAGLLLSQVCSHLRLTQDQFFGLRSCTRQHTAFWLDPDKTLSQHHELDGPPYIFYFGVRFYSEEPHKLHQNTREQFYLQLQQDVLRGSLLVPLSVRPRIQALLLQAERGDCDEKLEQNQEVTPIYRALRGVSQAQAQTLFLSLCCSLPMYGVTLFNVYGENQTEYFLGPTPGGVVIYKNRALVGHYYWRRISKVHFKNQEFELRVVNRNGSETCFWFRCGSRSDCKQLWTCCVQHHHFYRMQSAGGHRPKSWSSLRALVLPHFSSTNQRQASRHAPSEPTNQRAAHGHTPSVPSPTNQRRAPGHTPSESSPTNHRRESVNTCPEPTNESPVPLINIVNSDLVQTAPPAVPRCVGGASPEDSPERSSAPWETRSGGLFNPTFAPQRPHRRSRSLDGDCPIRAQQRGRARSHGNSSSESEKSLERRQKHRKKHSGSHGNRTPDSTHRCRRNRSHSPDRAVWKHIQKELVEPEAGLDRETEEIPFTTVQVSEQPIRRRRSARGQRQRQWASASESELVPPLPVTTAADTSCPVTTAADTSCGQLFP